MPISCNNPESVRELVRMRTAKDLAEELGVTRYYVAAMKRHGFRMPGGRASLQMAHDWLAQEAPDFQVDPRSSN